MKIMERKDAIRYIYKLATLRGWSYYDYAKKKNNDDMLHARIEGLGEFQYPSIALLSPKELNIVLRELFGEKGFLIKDEKLVYMLRMYCKDNDIPFSVVGTLILRIWKNNPKIYSVYHLDNKKIFVIKDRILGHFKDKDEKIEEEAENELF